MLDNHLCEKQLYAMLPNESANAHKTEYDDGNPWESYNANVRKKK